MNSLHELQLAASALSVRAVLDDAPDTASVFADLPDGTFLRIARRGYRGEATPATVGDVRPALADASEHWPVLVAFAERVGSFDAVAVTAARTEAGAVRLATLGDALLWFPTPAVTLFGATFP
jgi:hypothetical protein